MLEILIIILFFVSISVSYLIIRNHTFMSYIPMPPCNLFLGHVIELSNTDILDKITEYTIKYGGIIRIYIPLGKPSLVITDNDVIEQLLTSEKTIRKSRGYEFFRVWLGNGLLTNIGQEWKERRRVLNPCFGSVYVLKNYINVFEKHSNILMEILEKETGESNVDIFSLLKMYTMDVFSEIAMGTVTNCQQHQNLKYLQSIDKICEVIFKRIIYPWKRYKWSFKLSEDYRQQSEALEFVNSFVDKVIRDRIYMAKSEEERKDVMENTNQYSEKKQVVFLDLLLKCIQTDGLTLEDVKDEVNTFTVAGHDTTATTLAFALYILAKHPEIQEKLFEEQSDIFGKCSKDIRVTYSDIQKMKYLEMVINESIRLFPTIPFIGRILSDDITLDNGIVLPKDLNVIFCIYGCHHNPKYFPEPKKFIPERFSNNNIPNFSFIPFSTGLRSCIGKKFALLQVKFILSKIIRNFKLFPCVPEYDLKLLPFLSLTAINGIRISLKKRLIEEI